MGDGPPLLLLSSLLFLDEDAASFQLLLLLCSTDQPSVTLPVVQRDVADKVEEFLGILAMGP